MNGENFNLFLTLVKLKFYIVSMVDSPSAGKTFYLTEEFLERRAPEWKSEILSTLKSHNIKNDAAIAFDDAIVLKFRKIADEKEQHTSLSSILNNLEIVSKALSSSSADEYRSEREQLAHSILEDLFQLSSNWVLHKELENRFDEYSVLDEEEVIRPDEAEKLDMLNSNTDNSFKMISDLTTNYINQLADYYFKFGGDIHLKDFWRDLEKIKKDIVARYRELFNSFGLER